MPKDVDVKVIDNAAPVHASVIVLIIAFIILIAFYIGRFWYLGYQLVTEPEVLGQLGDYIGGILNPFISVLALYWLIRSVEIQKRELRETRSALSEGALSQAKQAEMMLVSARLTALSEILKQINFDIDLCLKSSERIFSQKIDGVYREHIYTYDGGKISFDQADQKMQEYSKLVDSALKKRGEIEDDISRILDGIK